MLRIVHDFTDHALAPHVHPRGTESRAALFFIGNSTCRNVGGTVPQKKKQRMFGYISM